MVFSTTTVKNPCDDEWGKLMKIIKHLNGTRNLKFTSMTYVKGDIKWCIDAFHA